MAALCTTQPQGSSPRNLLLRLIDAIAAEQMRYAHRAISWSAAAREQQQGDPAVESERSLKH